MNDDLSRLLAGELDPAEAEALRARIATDPALAARWERMRALPGRLRALPSEIEVPKRVLLGAGAPPPQRPRLSDRPPDRASAPHDAAARPVGPPPAPPDRRAGALGRALPWLGWAAAAALALVVARPAPTRLLLTGTELVEGRADVVAGDVRVTIDGAARVTVEPPPARGREVGAEDETMNTSHLLAALAGSVVTVTVTEGVAWLYADDAPATRVAAGETRTVGPDPAEAEATAPTRTARGGRRAEAGARAAGPAGRDAARVAELEQQVARLERERALAAARIRRHEGEPLPWPADVPGAYRPDTFERFLEERLADLPDTSLAALDCAEFPCVAILEGHTDAADWEDRLRGLSDGLAEAGYAGPVQVVGMGRETETDQGRSRLYAFAVAPADLADANRDRLQYRAESAMKDVTGVE